VFGAWSLFAQALICLRLDFNALKTFGIIPVIGALVLVSRGTLGGGTSTGERAELVESEEPDRRASKRRIPSWAWLFGPVLIAGLFQVGAEWGGWLVGSAYLFSWSRTVHPVVPPKAGRRPGPTRGQLAALLGLCVLAVLLTLGTHRPNADDAYFVSMIAATMDNPAAPLCGFDSLYKTQLSLTEQYLHYVQTYEFFVAFVSTYTGIAIHELYYVVFPACTAALAILAHWAFMRRFLKAWPTLIGLLGVVLLIVIWGDGHTYGNYAFVRLFQGKGILVTLGIPVLVHSCLEFRGDSSRRNGLILMLHLCACIGFATSGLVVAPVACALIWLPGARLSREFVRASAWALATTLPLVIAGASMLAQVRGNHEASAETSTPYSVRQAEGSPEVGKASTTRGRTRKQRGRLKEAQPKVVSVGSLFEGDASEYAPSQVVLGEDRRGLVLLGVFLLPCLAYFGRLRARGWLSAYVLICAFVLLCPLTPMLFQQKFARLFIWRIYWSWPVPLILGLTIGAAASCKWARPMWRSVVLALSVAAFAVAGRWTVTEKNWSFRHVGNYKVTPGYSVAIHLSSIAPAGGLALVPEDIAINLCGLRNAPPLVAVRRLYLRNLLWATSREGIRDRLELLRYVTGNSPLYGSKLYSVRKFLYQVEEFGITTIAYDKQHPHAEILGKLLGSRGFQLSHYQGYTLAVKPIVAQDDASEAADD